MLGEIGASKDLPEKRSEVVRSIPSATSAPSPKPGGLPFHLWLRREQAWEDVKPQSQPPLQMAGSFCGLQMTKSGWSHSHCGYRQLWLVTQLVTQLWHTLFLKDIIQPLASLISETVHVYREREDCKQWGIETQGVCSHMPGVWFSEKEQIWGVTFEARRISWNFD